MFRCFCLLFTAVAVLSLTAQAQTVPAVGTAATLDLATWNIEDFGDSGGPSNNELQLSNVLAVLRQAEIDLWALQELNDAETFDRLLDSLDAGWDGTRVEDDFGNLGYGFVYRTDVISALQVGTVLTGSSFEFAFRPPLQLRATVTLPDTSLEMRFLCLHMKAGVSTSDYDRRVAASMALKNYVDNLQAIGAHVVILGDLNDELISSITVGRPPSPYRNFLDDDAYLFATEPFDQLGDSNDQNTFCSSSTCSSGSVLDHLIATGNLADDYEVDSAAPFDALIDAITSYTSTTSDHLPVYARFDLMTSTPNEPLAPGRAFALEAPAPNPFTDATVLTFSLERPGPVRLEVFDALGRRMAVLEDDARPAGTYRVRLRGARFSPGLYLVRLTSGEQTSTRRLVRSR